MPVPRVSSQLFSNRGLASGSERGVGAREEDLEQTPATQAAATPLGEGRGTTEATGLSPTSPSIRMLHDPSSREERGDVEQLAGLVTHNQQRQGFLAGEQLKPFTETA